MPSRPFLPRARSCCRVAAVTGGFLCWAGATLTPLAGQSRAVEIAGVKPGISTRAQVDLAFGEPRAKLDATTFEYAPPPPMTGIGRVVIYYFSDTTAVSRLDAYLASPVTPAQAHSDETLGARTLGRDRPDGTAEELYAISLRGFIFSSNAPDAPVTAFSYLSTRLLADLYADRYHEYMNAKQYADARVEADKVVAVDPDYARGYLNQGDYLVSQKNEDEAIVRYIAAANAKYPPALVAAGHLVLISEYGLTKKWLDKAEAEFQQALAGGVNSTQRADAHVRWANVLVSAKRDADASKEFAAALTLNENSVPARLALADAAWSRKDWSGALPHYTALVRVLEGGGPPDDTLQKRRLDAYFREAFCLGEARRSQDAIPIYLKVLDLNPRYGAALNNLGDIYLIAGRTAEALDLYGRGLAANPDDTFLLNGMAEALIRTAKFDDARKYAERVVTQANNTMNVGRARLNLARAWAGLGKRREALDWLQQAADAGQHAPHLDTEEAFAKLRNDRTFKRLADQMK